MMIKRFIFPAILLAVLSAAAVSCVKDETVDSVGIQSEIGFDAAVSVDTTWTLSTKSSFIATDSADSLVIGEEVTLNRNSASYAATKGTVITGIDTYGSFATFAYTYAAADSWANVKSGSAPDFMYNLKSEKISGQWRPNDRLYYWPAASYKLSFFAYTPYTDYKADGTNPVSDYMSVSSASATGAPVIDYSVPSALDRQIDLMTASKTDVSGGFHQPVPMDFRHVLSGVRFTAKTKGLNITIKSVTITNVRDRGSLALDSDNWILSPDGSKSDFSLVKDVAVGGSSVAVNGPTEGVFFMLPQILPDGSKLEVVYTKEGGEEVTVTADFKGKSWEMGRMYTYNLTIGDSDVSYVLTVTPKSLPDDEGNLSNKAVYTIVSTKTTDYGGSSYVEDIPYTISGLPADVTYEINADGTVTITAPKRTGTVTTILCGSSVIMRDRPELGSEAAPIDLTTGDAKNGSRGETANCYVLNNAGWYCFPADVMGIGNSGLMYDATYSSKDKMLKNGYFSDYKSRQLTTSAAISTSGCTPVLLWEDSKGFINDLKLSSDGYISFKTSSKDDIVPSNAVIALRGSDGKIRWSWHIWCTIPTGTYTYISSATGEEVTADYAGASMVSNGGATTDAGYVYNTGRYSKSDTQITVTTQKKDSTWTYGHYDYDSGKWIPGHWEYFTTDVTETTYRSDPTAVTTKILAVNLGTVERDRSYTHYYRREFSFTVTQDVTNATAQEVVIQKDRDAVINPAGYSNTLYQWGRKDPFISGKISTFTDDNTGTYYNSSYPDGTNSFEDNASASNETNGVFGTYGVQKNGYLYYDGSDPDSKGPYYGKNLVFAINHPMTLITNNYPLDYSSSTKTTYIDWYTYGIDRINDGDEDDATSTTYMRYDNSCLWGSIYSDHDYQYSSTKTIYDPSPAGYKVAVGYCYSSDYFTKTGVFDYGNYTNVGFFPATGTRSSKTGQLANMGTRGDFWSASVRYILYGLDTACGITNSSTEFGHSYEQDTFSRGEALSVRPVGSDY